MDPQENFPDTESNTDEISDISSELDFADRSISNQTSGDDESPRGPHLTLVNVGEENHKIPSHEDPPSIDRFDIPNEEHSIYSLSSTETIERTLSLDSCSLTVTPVRKLSQADNTCCSNDISQDKSKEESPVGLDDSHNFPQIYSTTPLNMSDFSFSETSFDKSTPGHTRHYTQIPGDSSMTFIDSVSCSVEKRRADSKESPPICLEADGAEELCDAVSWSSSASHTLSDFDNASMDFIRTIERTHTTSQTSQNSKSSGGSSAGQNVHLLVDSWSDVRGPSPGYVISLDVSDLHIWAVTNYENIFYCPTHYEMVTWTQLIGQAKMIAVNNSGDVIWCIDGKNAAFARKGIWEGNLTGTEWVPVEKHVRHVAIDDTAVWMIMMNGDVFMRTQVSKEKPAGTSGRTIAVNTTYIQATCLDGLVWFVDRSSFIHVYKGNYLKPNHTLIP
jgi:hypothetical protein